MAAAIEKDHKNDEEGEVSEKTTFGREADFMEAMSIRFTDIANVSQILVVESPIPITKDLLTKAAILLRRRHPLLRSKVVVEVNPRNGKERFYFKEMETEDERVDVHVIDEVDWQDTFVRNGKTIYDVSVGPLWRLWLLRSQEIDEEASKTGHRYCTNLVLGYHHAIMDGNAGMRLSDHLLSYLEEVHSAGDDVPEVESLSLQPSLYDLLPPNAMRMSWRDKPMLLGFLLKETLTSRANLYMKLHPPVMSKDKEVVHEARIFPVVIPEPLTVEIMKRCKERGITVHGALTAALSVAMAKITFGDNFRNKKSIKTMFQVNMRRYMESNPGEDNMGSFFANTEMPVSAPVLNKPDDFWNLAQTCYRQVHHLLETDPMKVSKIMKYIIQDLGVDILKQMMKSAKKDGHGRMKPLFSISNMGRCDFVTRENGRMFELVGAYMGVSAETIGTIFVHNFFTFRKCMYWSIVYYTHITQPEKAQEYADLVMEILTNACELTK